MNDQADVPTLYANRFDTVKQEVKGAFCARGTFPLSDGR